MSSSPQNREPLIGRAFGCLRRAGAAGGARTVTIGELDLATAARAGVPIARAQVDSPSAVRDLRDASFSDLIGGHVPHDAAAQARRNGGRLTFAHCPASLRRLLGLLGLKHALGGAAPSSLSRSRPRTPSNGPRLGLVPARPLL